MARRGRVYTPTRTRDAERSIGAVEQEAMAGQLPLRDALSLVVLFELDIPASWSGRKREAAIAGNIHPTGRPDLDNLVKLLLDGMTGVVFTNDAQLVELRPTKKYGLNAKTIATVSQIAAYDAHPASAKAEETRSA
jgi:Holliday junction resolvase RusA-like endonuclease